MLFAVRIGEPYRPTRDLDLLGMGEALDLDFPTPLVDMPSPNVLAYPTETIVAEKVEAMVDLGRSNGRMKDFTDLAMRPGAWPSTVTLWSLPFEPRFDADRRRSPTASSSGSATSSLRMNERKRTGVPSPEEASCKDSSR